MKKRKSKKRFVIAFIVCSLLLSATVGMFFVSINDRKKEEKLQEQQEIARQQNEQEAIKQQLAFEQEEKERREAELKKENAYIIEKSEKVDLSYFDDAVFIGNSRTQGLMLYGGITNAKFYADKGLMIDKVDTKPISIMGEGKDTVMNALRRNKFAKYYIMLGTNELGWAYENIFVKDYQKLIEDIKEINPDGIIYLQSVLPVSKQKSDTDKVYNNPDIENYNELIKKLAKDNDVYYLNVAEQFKDDNGNLFDDSSSDGIHLKADYCKQWTEYLTTHTINSGNTSNKQEQKVADGIETLSDDTITTEEN